MKNRFEQGINIVVEATPGVALAALTLFSFINAHTFRDSATAEFDSADAAYKAGLTQVGELYSLQARRDLGNGNLLDNIGLVQGVATGVYAVAARRRHARRNAA